MGDAPRIVVTKDALPEAAKLLDAALAGTAGRFAVAGGSAASVLGELRPRLGARRWHDLRLTWVDERCVPFADHESNRGTAYAKGWLTPACPARLEIPLVLDGEAPADSVARVEEQIARELGGELDVTLLGMGEDGHIASLFPGQVWGAAGRTALHVPNAPKPPPDRISLTRSILATAKHHILVAIGEGKRTALQKLLAHDIALPASGLVGLTIVTDLDLGERA